MKINKQRENKKNTKEIIKRIPKKVLRVFIRTNGLDQFRCEDAHNVPAKRSLMWSKQNKRSGKQKGTEKDGKKI